jgi:hypothetical protein
MISFVPTPSALSRTMSARADVLLRGGAIVDESL